MPSITTFLSSNIIIVLLNFYLLGTCICHFNFGATKALSGLFNLVCRKQWQTETKFLKNSELSRSCKKVWTCKIQIFVSFIPFFILFLGHFGNEVTKIRKYYIIFLYILQGKIGKTGKTQKEYHATKVTRIPKTKRQKTKIWYERNNCLGVFIVINSDSKRMFL
jgi:hypothetical protein